MPNELAKIQLLFLETHKVALFKSASMHLIMLRNDDY